MEFQWYTNELAIIRIFVAAKVTTCYKKYWKYCFPAPLYSVGFADMQPGDFAINWLEDWRRACRRRLCSARALRKGLQVFLRVECFTKPSIAHFVGPSRRGWSRSNKCTTNPEMIDRSTAQVYGGRRRKGYALRLVAKMVSRVVTLAGRPSDLKGEFSTFDTWTLALGWGVI